ELLVERRLLETRAHPDADQHEESGKQERDAPPPRAELALGHRARQAPERAAGEHVPRGPTDLRPRGPEAASLSAQALRHEQHRAADLAADRDPLREPPHD